MGLTDNEILELHELLDDLVENNLAGERLRRLEEWVVESEAARRRYVRFMDLSASLRHYAEECFAEEDDEEGEKLIPYESEPQGLLRFFRSVAAVAAVVALVFVGFKSYQRSQNMPEGFASKTADRSEGSDFQSPASAWGQLTSAWGVEWASDSELRPNRGDSLRDTPMKLETGLAQIELRHGTTVVIEGPADFKLMSPNEVYLNKGKLRAIVPPAAAGFAVDMAKGKVTDLGTEFGLHVWENGTAEIYVYVGKVLYEGKDRDAERAFAELDAGQSVFVDETGELSWIDMPSEPFVGAAGLAYRSMEEAQRRYAAWVALSEELATDKRSALYFTFDDHRSWARALRDDARNKKKLEDGAIVGCKWIEGRWPGKGALRFPGANDRVRIKLREKLKSTTLVAWIRLDRLRKEFNPIVHLAATKKGAVSWGIDGRGRILLRTGYRENPGRENSSFVEYASPIVFRSSQFGQWVHLATTFDPKQGKVAHYLDGRPFSREAMRKKIPVLTLDGGELGNANAESKVASDGHSLSGAIDEFLVFRESLDAEEIRKLYEIGRPFSLPRLDRLP